MSTATDDALRTRLREVKAEVSELRDAEAAARRGMDKARDGVARVKASASELVRTPEFKAAERCKDELDAATQKLDDARAAEHGLIEQFAERQGLSHAAKDPGSRGGTGGGGWDTVARELDLPGGRTRVDLPLADLIGGPAMAGVTVKPSSGVTVPALHRPGITEMARDERHIFNVFPTEIIEDSTLGVSDYRQTGSRTVEGEVERDPMSVEEKATLDVEVTAETTPVRQVACVIDGVPAKVLEAVDTASAWLNSELSYQLRLAIDALVTAAALAAEPTKGEEGSDLIAKIRNGVTGMRAVGGKPSVLAVSPAVAAELDLTKTELGYTFALRDVGGSSPLFGLSVVEVPGLTKPMLIDPQIAGVLYLGMARMLVDPYSGLSTNEVRVRCEAECLMWIRDANGLYSIDKAKA